MKGTDGTLKEYYEFLIRTTNAAVFQHFNVRRKKHKRVLNGRGNVICMIMKNEFSSCHWKRLKSCYVMGSYTS